MGKIIGQVSRNEEIIYENVLINNKNKFNAMNSKFNRKPADHSHWNDLTESPEKINAILHKSRKYEI